MSSVSCSDSCNLVSMRRAGTRNSPPELNANALAAIDARRHNRCLIFCRIRSGTNRNLQKARKCAPRLDRRCKVAKAWMIQTTLVVSGEQPHTERWWPAMSPQICAKFAMATHVAIYWSRRVDPAGKNSPEEWPNRRKEEDVPVSLLHVVGIDLRSRSRSTYRYIHLLKTHN